MKHTVVTARPRREAGTGNPLLTYALSTSPQPWQVATGDQLDGAAAFTLVISNNTKNTVNVDNITIQFPVGPESCLCQTTAGIITNVAAGWNVEPPDGTITSGTATYTLKPSTTAMAPGTSTNLELASILVDTTPGVATITITENTATESPTLGFTVPTFPSGFYFDGLSANVYVDSNLQAVAQVSAGTAVVLSWNASALVGSVHVFYGSCAGSGDEVVVEDDQWTSDPLNADTVFTATTSVTVGKLSFAGSQSVAVAVVSPDLQANTLTVVDSVTAGATTLDASGVTAPAVTADTITSASGGSSTIVSAASVTVSDGTSTATVAPTGFQSTAGSNTATVGATGVQVTDGTNTTTVAPTAITATSALGLPAFTLNGPASMLRGSQVPTTPVVAPCDGFAIAVIVPQGDVDDMSVGSVSITTALGTFTAYGMNNSPTDTHTNYPMPGTLVIPVQQGDTISWSFNPDANSDTIPTAYYFFMGMGQSLYGAPATALTPAPVPPAPAQAAPRASPRPAPSARADAVVAILGRALPALGADDRHQLAAALVDLVQ